MLAASDVLRNCFCTVYVGTMSFVFFLVLPWYSTMVLFRFCLVPVDAIFPGSIYGARGGLVFLSIARVIIALNVPLRNCFCGVFVGAICHGKYIVARG